MTHKGTAVITGATTALGAAFANQLASRGYDLILIAADRPKLLAVAALITDKSGRAVEVLDGDLTILTDIARIEGALKLDASITLLVNHHDKKAGADPESAISLGVMAPARLTCALAPGFMTRRTGALVNLVSVSGWLPERGEAIESASHAFVVSLAHALHQQLTDAGVLVQTVLYSESSAHRTQSASATARASLNGLDCGVDVILGGLVDRDAWNTFEAAKVEFAKHLTRFDTPTPSRTLH